MEELIICVPAPLLLAVYASDDFEECKKLMSSTPWVFFEAVSYPHLSGVP